MEGCCLNGLIFSRERGCSSFLGGDGGGGGIDVPVVKGPEREGRAGSWYLKTLAL